MQQSSLTAAEHHNPGAEPAGLLAAIEQAAEAIVITDTQTTIRYVNPAFTKMTAYSSKEVIGQNPRILKSGCQDPSYYKNLWQTNPRELINRRKNGNGAWQPAWTDM